MQTQNIKVCNMAMFGTQENFHMSNLLYAYENPVLKEVHKNSFYMFLVIENAVGSVVIDKQELIVNQPQIIIIPPNCINQITFSNNPTGKIICFSATFFSLRYNDNRLDQFSFLVKDTKKSLLLSKEKSVFFSIFLDLMYSEFKDQKKEFSKALRSYLNLFLIETERLYNPVKKNNFSMIDEKTAKFQKLIEEKYKTYKLPSEYARMLNVSTNHLNKICKKTIGETSGEIIRKHVLLEAKRMLHYTNYSVGEIASHLGFEHPSYFITFFKKQSDETPEQFRTNSKSS